MTGPTQRAVMSNYKQFPRLYVEVRDPDCEGDDVWSYSFHPDISKATVMEALEVLHPDAFSVWMVIEEKEDA